MKTKLAKTQKALLLVAGALLICRIPAGKVA